MILSWQSTSLDISVYVGRLGATAQSPTQSRLTPAFFPVAEKIDEIPAISCTDSNSTASEPNILIGSLIGGVVASLAQPGQGQHRVPPVIRAQTTARARADVSMSDNALDDVDSDWIRAQVAQGHRRTYDARWCVRTATALDVDIGEDIFLQAQLDAELYHVGDSVFLEVKSGQWVPATITVISRKRNRAVIGYWQMMAYTRSGARISGSSRNNCRFFRVAWKVCAVSSKATGMFSLATRLQWVCCLKFSHLTRARLEFGHITGSPRATRHG